MAYIKRKVCIRSLVYLPSISTCLAELEAWLWCICVSVSLGHKYLDPIQIARTILPFLFSRKEDEENMSKNISLSEPDQKRKSSIALYPSLENHKSHFYLFHFLGLPATTFFSILFIYMSERKREKYLWYYLTYPSPLEGEEEEDDDTLPLSLFFPLSSFSPQDLTFPL